MKEQKMGNNKLWVRFYLKNREDFSFLQNMNEVELFAPTLKPMDDNTFLIDGYVNKENLNQVRSRFRYKVLGDVGEMMAESVKYVTGKNRFSNH